MKYKFKYRNKWFWKTVVIIGHQLKDNRMDLFFEDGSILSLGEWSKYDVKLGQDWVLAIKSNMSKEAGIEVK